MSAPVRGHEQNLTRRGALAGLLVFSAGSAHGQGSAPAALPASGARPAPPTTTPLETRVIARGLDTPWGLVFMPDGRMLVTERPGRLRLIERDGQVRPAITGVPAVAAIRQGGLLGIALDPAFAQNRFVYLAFAERRGGDTNSTSVFRGRLSLSGTALEAGQVIYRQDPAHSGGFHFGSRLVFDRSGHLFVTSGDRWGLSQESQNPANTIAKVVRITRDGQAAPGNPGLPGWNPVVWSIGHRNTQGATLHPETGELWIADHGPRGGDTLHVVRAGRNHGWPLVSYGMHYDGRAVGEGQRVRDGIVQPITHWSPTSVAPSGLTFVTSPMVPEWRGNLLMGALAAQALIRIVVDGERYVGEERLLGDLGHRFRDVVQGPDGAFYLLTDASDGQLIRVSARGR